MRRLEPIIRKSDHYPVAYPKLSVTWSLLWEAMGKRRAGQSAWRRPESWAAEIDRPESTVRKMLAAAQRQGLVRKRLRVPRGHSRSLVFFARTDQVAVCLSQRESDAFNASSWRW